MQPTNAVDYSAVQRRQLEFLCEQARNMEELLRDLPHDGKAYAGNMRIYLATVKEIRALRMNVESCEAADELLAFAPVRDAL